MAPTAAGCPSESNHLAIRDHRQWHRHWQPAAGWVSPDSFTKHRNWHWQLWLSCKSSYPDRTSTWHRQLQAVRVSPNSRIDKGIDISGCHVSPSRRTGPRHWHWQLVAGLVSPTSCAKHRHWHWQLWLSSKSNIFWGSGAQALTALAVEQVQQLVGNVDTGIGSSG